MQRSAFMFVLPDVVVAMDGLIFDAVRIRLLETGEAVKARTAELRDSEPTIRGVR